MSDEIQKTALRLPKGLHEAIHAAAKESGRTMNAEIVYRLQQSFASKDNESNVEKPKHIIEAKVAGKSSASTANLFASLIDFVEQHKDEIELERKRHEEAMLEHQQWLEENYPVDEDDIEPEDEFFGLDLPDEINEQSKDKK